jgi:hypothetical protein
MTTYPTSSWSESLQQQTRQAIAQLPLTPDGQLHFKHPTQGYAYAKLDDLMRDRLVLHCKNGSSAYRLAGVDALLRAGWVID